MTEQEAITTIKNIIDGQITYDIEIVSRKYETASQLMVSIAVISKKDKITPEIIADLMDYNIQNSDYELVLLETQKEIGSNSLGWEVMIIQAKIQYLKVR